MNVLSSTREALVFDIPEQEKALTRHRLHSDWILAIYDVDDVPL